MTREERKSKLRVFICTELLRDPAYPLRDDEALVSGGLLDSAALARIAVFAEQELGTVVPDTAFSPENFDTVDAMLACFERFAPAAPGS